MEGAVRAATPLSSISVTRSNQALHQLSSTVIARRTSRTSTVLSSGSYGTRPPSSQPPHRQQQGSYTQQAQLGLYQTLLIFAPNKRTFSTNTSLPTRAQTQAQAEAQLVPSTPSPVKSPENSADKEVADADDSDDNNNVGKSIAHGKKNNLWTAYSKLVTYMYCLFYELLSTYLFCCHALVCYVLLNYLFAII